MVLGTMAAPSQGLAARRVQAVERRMDVVLPLSSHPKTSMAIPRSRERTSTAHCRSSSVGRTGCRPTLAGVAKSGCGREAIASEATGRMQSS